MLFARALPAVCLAFAFAFASASASAQDAGPASSAAAATRLAITVVTQDADVPTLQQRVSSWFSDGTPVSVAVARELPAEGIFRSGPHEVRVWVVRLSADRAMVVFSTAAELESARYLLREVRLVSGFDELGLERLASVIHAAFVALREGIEGSARPQVERELVEAGLLQGSTPAAAPAPVAAPALATPPAEPAARVPVADSNRANLAAPRSRAFVLGAGYGTRLRGAEQLGHGPMLSAGVQVPGSLGTFDALLNAHLLVGSDFDAGAFAASVQTSAFRAQLGLEPELSRRVTLQALLGAGADWARVSAQVRAPAASSQVEARQPGSQWRGALELSLGLWWKSRLVAWGATAHATYLYGDVHYSLESAEGQRRLVTPWPLQPGLSLQARFLGAP